MKFFVAEPLVDGYESVFAFNGRGRCTIVIIHPCCERLTVHRKLISKKDLPVVNVGNKDNPIYVLPEVCTLAPGQHAHAKLSPKQTETMIEIAVGNPGPNTLSILDAGFWAVGLDPATNPRLVLLAH